MIDGGLRTVPADAANAANAAEAVDAAALLESFVSECRRRLHRWAVTRTITRAAMVSTAIVLVFVMLGRLMHQPEAVSLGGALLGRAWRTTTDDRRPTTDDRR